VTKPSVMDSKTETLPAQPLSRLIPNVVTLLGLCSGITSIRYALDARWEMAVTFVVIAALLDAMDGRLARMMRATSNFGAQLDSLADFISFGISPALILYLWQLHTIPIKRLGWALVLIYAICGALRLARFNTHLGEAKPAWQDYFFTGIPIPAGALLALMPMMLTFQLEWNIFADHFVLGGYMIAIAILMASRIPTFSAKKVIIPPEFVSLTLIGAGLVIAGLLIEPWLTLPIIGVVYLGSMPITVLWYYRLKHTTKPQMK
jgi:CDP-diacylglycerol--serine O-phosphatidyltransferase